MTLPAKRLLHTPGTSTALSLPTKQAAGCLLRLYARLRGELEKANDGEAVLVQRDDAMRAIGHIAALMPILDVNFDPSALKPVRTRIRIGPLKHGELRTSILAALRAGVDWMTYPQIATAVLERRGIVLTMSQHKHFLQKLREAVHALGEKGVVEREHQFKLQENTQLQRWRLSSKLFRRATPRLPAD